MVVAIHNAEDWLDPIWSAVVSDVQACGFFDSVNTHELRRKTMTKLSAVVWLSRLRPIDRLSGLATAGTLAVFTVRIGSSMTQQPEDVIDPIMAKAISNLYRRYIGEFTFAGAVTYVDVFGIHGVPLDAVTGYIAVSNQYQRIADITVPCAIADVYDEVP